MPRPFTKDHVIATTLIHMRGCIDNSIKKTFQRVPEFVEDPEKSKEVFITLTELHAMRKQINAMAPKDAQNDPDSVFPAAE